MKANYRRQSGIVDIESFRDNPISIVGCGAIGSYVASSLAKMGLTNFHLYDFDKVEAHNLPNQFFKESDVGKLKVDATYEAMIDFNSDVGVIGYTKKVEKSAFPLDAKIVISCVDVMEVRKYLFEKCKKSKDVQLFIDCRMGGLQGQVYVVDLTNKKEIANYEKSLFSNEEAVQLRCTEKSIIFTVLGIASIVCGTVVKVIKGEPIRNYLVLDYVTPQIF